MRRQTETRNQYVVHPNRPTAQLRLDSSIPPYYYNPHLLGTQGDDVIADEDKEDVAGSCDDRAGPAGDEDVREEGGPVADIRFGEGGHKGEDHETHMEELQDCEREEMRGRGRRYDGLGWHWESYLLRGRLEEKKKFHCHNLFFLLKECSNL